MSIRALITEGIGPGGTIPFLITGGLGGVSTPVVVTVGATQNILGKPKRKRKFIKSVAEPEPLVAVAANDDQPQITLPDSEQEDEDFIIQWLLSRAA